MRPGPPRLCAAEELGVLCPRGGAATTAKHHAEAEGVAPGTASQFQAWLTVHRPPGDRLARSNGLVRRRIPAAGARTPAHPGPGAPCHFLYEKAIPSLSMVKVLLLTVPTVLPAPFHCMFNFIPSRL